jgi:hypothetical protein
MDVQPSLWSGAGWLPCSRRLTNSGSMRSGALYPRATSAPRINVRDSTSWPTATTADSRSSARHTTTTGVMHPGTMLTDAARMWRTPDSPNAGGVRNRQASRGQGHQMTIAEQAEHWPTPEARDYRSPMLRETFLERRSENSTRGEPLSEFVTHLWPTPAARDHKGENSAAHLDVATGRKHLDQLPNYVAHLWATPMVPNGGRTLSDEDVLNKGTTPRGKRQVDLNSQTRLWATPRAEDAECCGNHPGANDSLTGQTKLWKTPHGFANTDRFGKTGGGGGEFAKQAMAWPTPTAEPYGSSQNGINGIGGTHERPSANTPSLDRLARSFPQPLPTETPGKPSSETLQNSRPRLNPRFVGWLMSFPPGWTSCGPTAMQWSLWQQRSRSWLWQLARCAD